MARNFRMVQSFILFAGRAPAAIVHITSEFFDYSLVHAYYGLMVDRVSLKCGHDNLKPQNFLLKGGDQGNSSKFCTSYNFLLYSG